MIELECEQEIKQEELRPFEHNENGFVCHKIFIKNSDLLFLYIDFLL